MQKNLLLLIIAVASSYFFLNGMDPLIKQKMEKVSQDFNKDILAHCEWCEYCKYNMLCQEERNLWAGLRYQKAHIMMKAGNQVDDQEKLNHIMGDDFYQARKDIITEMIQKGINPNHIKYQGNETPYYEAVLYEDVKFTRFLIQHGAEPDLKTLKYIQKAKPEFLAAVLRK